MSPTVVGAVADGSATATHPNGLELELTIEYFALASRALCTSLKKYVTTQIGIRLERDAATLKGNGAAAADVSEALRKAVMSTAVWDFPFLEEVDWDAEQAARRRHFREMLQQPHLCHWEKWPGNNAKAETNTEMTRSVDGSRCVAATGGPVLGSDAVGGDMGDGTLFQLPRTTRKKKMTQKSRPHPSAESETAKGQAKTRKKYAPKDRKKHCTFEDRLDQCREFRNVKGHLRVPLLSTLPRGTSDFEESHDAEDVDAGFAKWAQTMRENHHKFFNCDLDSMKRKENMSNKLERLEEMGFNFELEDHTAPQGMASSATVLQNEANDSVCSGTASTGTALSNSSAARSREQPGANSWKGPIWEWRLEQCRQFKSENGHLNMTGQWAERMRGLYKRGLQSAGKKSSPSSEQALASGHRQKVKALESLGFAFEGKFDINLKKLEEFKAREGHCRVPIIKAGPDTPDTSLSNWVAMVRREHASLERGETSEYLNVQRMQKLVSIGFIFQARPKQIPWEVNFQKLKAYKEENDGRDPITSHGEIGRWIQTQRHYYNNKIDGKKSNILTDEREEKLRSIGFVFQAGPRADATAIEMAKVGMQKTWDDRLQEFVKWKEEHGHPYVPTVAEGEYKQLGRWVANQRMAYRGYQVQAAGGGGSSKDQAKKNRYGVLTAEKALKLSNAGFAFDASHVHKTPRDVGHGSAQGNAGLTPDNNERTWTGRKQRQKRGENTVF